MSLTLKGLRSQTHSFTHNNQVQVHTTPILFKSVKKNKVQELENTTFFQILRLSVEKWDIFQQLFCNFSSTKYLYSFLVMQIFLKQITKTKLFCSCGECTYFYLDCQNAWGFFHVWKINTFNSAVTFCKKYVCEFYPSKTIFFRRKMEKKKVP